MNFTNEHIKFGTQHIMNLVYTSYKNETFNEASNYHPTKEINYIINKFIGNNKFFEILKEYEKYYNSIIIEIIPIKSASFLCLKIGGKDEKRERK